MHQRLGEHCVVTKVGGESVWVAGRGHAARERALQPLKTTPYNHAWSISSSYNTVTWQHCLIQETTVIITIRLVHNTRSIKFKHRACILLKYRSCQSIYVFVYLAKFILGWYLHFSDSYTHAIPTLLWDKSSTTHCLAWASLTASMGWFFTSRKLKVAGQIYARHHQVMVSPAFHKHSVDSLSSCRNIFHRGSTYSRYEDCMILYIRVHQSS